jgi:hypothetical protein
LERRCAAHVNVDSTGGTGATVLRNAAAAAELAPLAGEAIRQQTQHDYVGKRKNRSSDDSFPGIGIPSMFGSLSEQPPGPVKMRNSLGWWWHTPHDTLDKVDEANLVRDTKVFVHTVYKLVSEPVLPIDYSAHAAVLLGELDMLKNTLSGRFDLTPLLAGAMALRDTAAAVTAKASGAGEAEAARMSTAIMRASRAMVPMDYTTGDRFMHDFALPLPNWPTLQPIRDFAKAAAGSDAARFAEVSATRARNRVLFALRQANAALGSVL